MISKSHISELLERARKRERKTKLSLWALGTCHGPSPGTTSARWRTERALTGMYNNKCPV